MDTIPTPRITTTWARMMPLGKRRRGAERPVAVDHTDYPETQRISAETLNYDSDSDSDHSSTGAPDDEIQSEYALIPVAEDDSRNRNTSVRKSPSTQSRRNRRTNRRRALTDFQLCRSQKTKCDNKRPSCGSFSVSGASCIYTEPVNSSSSTGPSINVSNTALLEKPNHVVGRLLERFQGSQGQSLAIQELRRGVASETSWDEPLFQQNSNRVSAFSDEGFGQLGVSEKAALTSACESILRWSVLQHLCVDENVTSFPLESAGRDEARQWANEAGPAHRIERRPVLQEENIWSLCQKFLVLIHIKNTILEASSLRRYARQTTEYGHGWDGPGCLVVCLHFSCHVLCAELTRILKLLACALACLAL